MLKPLLIAAALGTFGAAGAYAQSTPPASPPSTSTPAPQMQDRAAGPAFTADTRKLIGRKVKNTADETVGDIEAIYLDKDGKVDSVIIGVGGFLGMGERNVRVAWKDLTIADNGEKVTIAATKDQLKALPEYKYREASYRGQAFTDTGIYRDSAATAPRVTTVEPPKPAPAPATTATAPTPPTMTATTTPPPAPRTTAMPAPVPPSASVPIQPTKDFNADGFISTEAILGATVRNGANETLGDVKDVYVDKDGKIQMIIVSVGGFLGMGTKNVAVKWTELQMRRDGNKLILLSSWTQDSLKAMPDYTYDRYEAQQK